MIPRRRPRGFAAWIVGTARAVAARSAAVAMALLLLPGGASGDTMRATIYDDGIACPGGCDAHVVFHPSHNGTVNAFRPPLSSREAPQRCVDGEACIICFDESAESCIETLYRGSGPPRGKFDLTPAFFGTFCPRADLPAAVREACDGFEVGVRHYESRINCFEAPDHPQCAGVMAAAKAAQEADRTAYESCRELGQDTFNSRQDDPERQRSLGCRYSKLPLGGPNSAGVRWRVLLPASCRPKTYVGAFGTDCCSNNLYAAAAFHPECAKYFPPQLD